MSKEFNKHLKLMIDPSELDYKFLASEISRAMRNHWNSAQPQKKLEQVARCVLENHLYHKPLKRISVDKKDNENE